jgi:F-type H+-transporting ATPase subunit delta
MEKNIVKATFTTTAPITEDLRARVLSKLKEVLGDVDIQVEERINPSLIGGFILQVGDREYNLSAANKLRQLKREFVSNPI